MHIRTHIIVSGGTPEIRRNGITLFKHRDTVYIEIIDPSGPLIKGHRGARSFKDHTSQLFLFLNEWLRSGNYFLILFTFLLSHYDGSRLSFASDDICHFREGIVGNRELLISNHLVFLHQRFILL